MKPYYQDQWSTIYHGDCRDIAPSLSGIDAVITDPPYGIKADNRDRILSRGKLAAPIDYGISNWDASPISGETIKMLMSVSGVQIIWGGNYIDVPPSSCWLVWDKDNGGNDFADCELAWTNLKQAVRMIRYRWNGMLQENMARKEVRFHPTQKPVQLMVWCLGQANVQPGQTILDPYMGSGSTLVAAKMRGVKAIGIELEEKYVEIAIERLRQEVLPFSHDSTQGQGEGGKVLAKMEGSVSIRQEEML